jgi:hypothetical protein
MSWLEIISIRTAGTIEIGKVLDICRQCCQCAGAGELLKIIVYRSAQYETDVSIHLHWQSDPGPECRSILGREVRAALGDLGLICHSVWVEQEKFIILTPSKMTGNRVSQT